MTAPPQTGKKEAMKCVKRVVKIGFRLYVAQAAAGLLCGFVWALWHVYAG